MSKTQRTKLNKVKKIVKDYIDLLKEDNFPIDSA